VSIESEVRPVPSFAEATAIQAFWERNYARFTELYPERFVAVKDEEVVLVAEELGELLDGLAALGLDPKDDVAIEFVSTRSHSLIL